MRRTEDGQKYPYRMDVRVSDEQHDWIKHVVEEGQLESASEAVRLGLDTLMMSSGGEAVVVTGPGARTLRQTAEDLGLDVETAALMGTYLIALFATVAPSVEGEVIEMASEVQESLRGENHPPNPPGTSSEDRPGEQQP